jgi:hypothetical protein
MGYILNEFVVAYLPNHSPGFAQAIRTIAHLSSDPEFGMTISNSCKLAVNEGPVTITLGPDGSKEGLGTSYRGDVFRQRFMEAAKLCEYANIVHFKMGGGDCETKILFQSDKKGKA